MKKVPLFLAILLIGFIGFILTVFVFQIDGNLGMSLTILSAFLFIGGIFGACFFSKYIRELFGAILEAILSNL